MPYCGWLSHPFATDSHTARSVMLKLCCTRTWLKFALRRKPSLKQFNWSRAQDNSHHVLSLLKCCRIRNRDKTFSLGRLVCPHQGRFVIGLSRPIRQPAVDSFDRTARGFNVARKFGDGQLVSQMTSPATRLTPHPPLRHTHPLPRSTTTRYVTAKLTTVIPWHPRCERSDPSRRRDWKSPSPTTTVARVLL